jgi:hypothetical protein
MTREEAEHEMTEGYLDGLDADSPEPSANRSHSYRHGFQSGRDDLNGHPCAPYWERRRQAKEAIEADCKQ